MTLRPVDIRDPSMDKSEPPRGRLIALWSLAAVAALAVAGCVTAPRQPEGPVAHDDLKATPGDQAAVAGSRTDFHEKATERQQFQVHIDFGRAFETQGNLDAAIQEYQDALKVVENKRRGPFRAADAALAHRRMGSAFDRTGRFAQAETHYQKALKLSPKDPKVWNDAGYSYYLQGRWADSERALNTAAQLAPEDERIRTNLGLTLAAQGRTQDALPLLSRSNGEATGHANLGYLLAATGQLDLARQQYETALALRPDMALARRALAQIDYKQRNATATTAGPNAAAQRERSTAHPIDPSVSQASTTTATARPPLPARILPEARAPIVVDREVSGAPSSIPDPVPFASPPSL